MLKGHQSGWYSDSKATCNKDPTNCHMIQCWYFRLLCQTTKNGVETKGIDSSLTHFHRATQVFWSQNPGTSWTKALPFTGCQSSLKDTSWKMARRNVSASGIEEMGCPRDKWRRQHQPHVPPPHDLGLRTLVPMTGLVLLHSHVEACLHFEQVCAQVVWVLLGGYSVQHFLLQCCYQ